MSSVGEVTGTTYDVIEVTKSDYIKVRWVVKWVPWGIEFEDGHRETSEMVRLYSLNNGPWREGGFVLHHPSEEAFVLVLGKCEDALELLDHKTADRFQNYDERIFDPIGRDIWNL